MAYGLCTRCSEIYKEGLEWCPKLSCMHPLIDVDENILPHILLLNKKGYETSYCCSGHIWNDDNCHFYIVFKSNCLTESDIKKLPSNFCVEKENLVDENNESYDTISIRPIDEICDKFPVLLPNVRYVILNDMLTRLLGWVQRLPDLNAESIVEEKIST